MARLLPKSGFAYKPDSLKCGYCKKVGHDFGFCPSRPNEPSRDRAVPWVDALLASPPVDPATYCDGKTWDQISEHVRVEGARLNKGNPWKDSTYVLDNLRKHLGFWKVIGTNKAILSWVAYGAPIRFIRPPPKFLFQNHTSALSHADFVEEEIAKHTEAADGRFLEVKPSQVKISSPIHVVDQYGKLRRCDDMRFQNAFTAKPKFKLMSLKHDVPAIVKKNNVQLTVDLKKAYYSIPVDPAAVPYQCFSWRGKYYASFVLLFGHRLAPFIFNKTVRPIVKFFALARAPSVNFFDDFLFSTGADLLVRLQAFVSVVLTLLGWSFNDKGETGAAVKFLGFIVDSTLCEYRVPEDKVARLTSLLRQMQANNVKGIPIPLQSVQRATGCAISMSLAIPDVRVWTRALYALQNRMEEALTLTCSLSVEAVEDLRWLEWLLANKNQAPFFDGVIDRELWNDASESAWGCVSRAFEKWGYLPASAMGTSSTSRELLGLRLALQDPEVSAFVRGKRVRVNMDSSASVANLQKGGGGKGDLCEHVRQIWKLAHDLDSHLTPQWLRRTEPGMVWADAKSKCSPSWTLKPEVQARLTASFAATVVVPEFNQIQNFLIGSQLNHSLRTTALVLPVWPACSWWTTVNQLGASFHKLPHHEHLFQPAPCAVPRPNWSFVLATFPQSPLARPVGRGALLSALPTTLRR